MRTLSDFLVAMSSQMSSDHPSCRSRSSIPFLTAAHRARATMASPDPGSRICSDPRAGKLVYTDADVQECPPEGASAPIIPFPGDDAKNAVVKAYLFAILTKTGWGLAVDCNKEIRATINKFIGNGWELLNKYRHGRLKELCPTQLTTLDDNGVAKLQKVSASTRSHIGNCIMREMERYFETVEWVHHKQQLGGQPKPTLGSRSAHDGGSRQYTCDRREESLEERQIMRLPKERMLLPDAWLTDRIRSRQAYVEALSCRRAKPLNSAQVSP